jgi:hypothetical protein
MTCVYVRISPGFGKTYHQSGDNKEDAMNVFNLLVVMSGLAAVGTFLLGARSLVQVTPGTRGARSSCSWQGVFMFFVFATILAAPLSR